MRTHDVELNCTHYEVDGYFEKGTPQTYDYPGDPDEFIIVSVFRVEEDGSYTEIEELDNDLYNQLETLILDNYVG